MGKPMPPPNMPALEFICCIICPNGLFMNAESIPGGAPAAGGAPGAAAPTPAWAPNAAAIGSVAPPPGVVPIPGKSKSPKGLPPVPRIAPCMLRIKSGFVSICRKIGDRNISRTCGPMDCRRGSLAICVIHHKKTPSIFRLIVDEINTSLIHKPSGQPCQDPPIAEQHSVVLEDCSSCSLPYWDRWYLENWLLLVKCFSGRSFVVVVVVVEIGGRKKELN